MDKIEPKNWKERFFQKLKEQGEKLTPDEQEALEKRIERLYKVKQK